MRVGRSSFSHVALDGDHVPGLLVESCRNSVVSCRSSGLAFPNFYHKSSKIVAGTALLSKSLEKECIVEAKALCVYGHSFDDEIVDYIVGEVLPSTAMLQKIEIGETQFSSAGMKSLLRAIWTRSPCDHLEELVLHDVHLHFEETMHLKEVVMKNCGHLRRLVLQRCHMDDSTVEPIVQALPHCEQLLEVSLVDNDIMHALVAPTEAGDIFPATLQLFDVSGNRMEPKHFTGLSRAIRKCASNLREIYMARCCVTENGLRTLLYGGLYNSQALSVLNVSSGRLLHTAGKVLSSIISECPNIQRVYLQDNLLDAEGAAQIALAIPNAKKLTVLGMGRCHLGGRGARCIVEAVRKSPSLRELDLSGNGVMDEDVHQICDCGDEESFCLSFLDLSDNPITERCRCSLQELVKRQRDVSCIVVVRGTGLAAESPYVEYQDTCMPC